MNKNTFFLSCVFILSLSFGCTYTKEFGAQGQQPSNHSEKTSFDQALERKDVHDEQATQKRGWSFTPISDNNKCASDMRPGSSERYLGCENKN
jgi:hypothetical protein